MRRLENRAGYMLIEASATYVLVAFAIVAFVPIFTLAIRANVASEEAVKGALLAQELLEEIKLHKWDENSLNSVRPGYPAYSPTAALGTEAGETAADKTTFDDIDDFAGWSESSPKDPLGGAIPGFPGYSRSVTVQYVASGASSFTVSASTTSYKLVTVCVSKTGVAQTCLPWVAANR